MGIYTSTSRSITTSVSVVLLYGPPERVIGLDEKRQERMQGKQKRKQRRKGFGSFLMLSYPLGVINGYRPPEQMIGWDMREKEVEGLTERGRLRAM